MFVCGSLWDFFFFQEEAGIGVVTGVQSGALPFSLRGLPLGGEAEDGNRETQEALGLPLVKSEEVGVGKD